MTLLQTKHNCKEELRNADLRATPARLGVLEVLENADSPLDVATILADLRAGGIEVDRVTVFRIMHMFTQKGIVMPIQLHEGKFRYEHALKATHHHFICEKCGEIEDISDCTITAIEKEITQRRGLLIKRHSLEFFGLCKDCQK